MKNEDILSKSRSENRDEREVQVKDKSIAWTFITMVGISAIFAALRAFRGEDISDFAASICAAVSVSFFYRFAKTRQIFFLVCGIILICTAILSVISYFGGF